MGQRKVIVVALGASKRVGNVEFLALSQDSPASPVRILNFHAPAGFDRRLPADAD